MRGDGWGLVSEVEGEWGWGRGWEGCLRISSVSAVRQPVGRCFICSEIMGSYFIDPCCKFGY